MTSEPFFQSPFRRPRTFISGMITLAIAASSAGAQRAGDQAPVLTLRAVLDSVRASYPELLAASGRIRVAEGARVTARTIANPTVSYQVDQTPFPGAGPLPGLQREAMTTATLPLEFLYQRGSKVARANADVRAAQADAAFSRQHVALDAAAAFYRAGIAQTQSATTHDLLGWLDTLVVYNRARVQEGATAEADLIRSELERDRVAAEASMQDAELAQSRAALGAFISASRNVNAAFTIGVDDLPLPLPAFGVATSIAARADLRAAHERVDASNAAIASERSMIVRQVGATIGTLQTAGTTSMIAGVSVPFPLFDQNRGDIQRATAERDVAVFQLAAQERFANAELQGAYDAARILTDRAALLARRDSMSFLARADESRRIALGAYREGAVPLFQVIDAARSWAEARMTFYRTIAAQQQSVLSLLVAQSADLFAADAPLSNRTNLR